MSLSRMSVARMTAGTATAKIRYEVMERRVHESLYENLCLLAQRHEFPEKNILSKDMFKKPNKMAFFHVIRYLFNILDPVRTTSVKRYPIPYDSESEKSFRSEVMNHLSVLKDSYKNSDIPIITNSHLVSPGGIKFATFMFSVSQLVLKEDLRKMGVSTLNRPRKECSKEHKENCRKCINVMSNSVVDKTGKIADTFEIYLDESEKNIELMKSSISELDLGLKQKRIAYEQLKCEFDKKYPSCPSLQSLQEKFSLMQQEHERFLAVCDTFTACHDLIQFITSPATTLEYKNDQSDNLDRLNLIEFFKSSVQIIKRKALDLPGYSSSFLEENKKTLEDLMEQLLDVYNESQQKQENLKKLSEHILSDDGIL